MTINNIINGLESMMVVVCSNLTVELFMKLFLFIFLLAIGIVCLVLVFKYLNPVIKSKEKDAENKGKEIEFHNREKELDNRKKELDNRKKELDNREKELDIINKKIIAPNDENKIDGKKTPWMRRPRMTVKAISLKFVLGKWW